MRQIFPSDKIYVAQSDMKNAGRGVFARIPIHKGELIERCPIIKIPEHDTAHLRETILITYFYYFGIRKETAILALGCGSIYNHTATPNAMYSEKLDEQTIEFTALRDISKDEEITVHYNQNNPHDKRPLWFETMLEV